MFLSRLGRQVDLAVDLVVMFIMTMIVGPVLGAWSTPRRGSGHGESCGQVLLRGAGSFSVGPYTTAIHHIIDAGHLTHRCINTLAGNNILRAMMDAVTPAPSLVHGVTHPHSMTYDAGRIHSQGPDDLRIAQELLLARENGWPLTSLQEMTLPEQRPTTTRRVSSTWNSSGSRSRVNSGTWTTVSHRIFTDSSASSARDPLNFLAQYDALAHMYGLSPLSEGHSSPLVQPGPVTSRDTTKVPLKVTAVQWLQKLLHKANDREPQVKVMNRYHSTGNLLGQANERKTTIRGRSLDQICRLGGLGCLVLPERFAPGELIIPTCLSATASHLALNAVDTPGIFRISGTKSAVASLFDHFIQNIEQAEHNKTEIQQTVSCGILPLQLTRGIHDIGTVFKRFLSELPGGILGSLELFNALQETYSHLYLDLDNKASQQVVPKLIALAVASEKSQIRVSIICAVFGLLSMIGKHTESTLEGDKAPQDSQLMTYHALGRVFGPLLLGDLTEAMDTGMKTKSCTSLNIPILPTKVQKASGKNTGTQGLHCSALMLLELERAELTAGVAEMIVTNWQEIVSELRQLEAISTHQDQNKQATTHEGACSVQNGLEKPEQVVSYAEDTTHIIPTMPTKPGNLVLAVERTITFDDTVKEQISMKSSERATMVDLTVTEQISKKSSQVSLRKPDSKASSRRVSELHQQNQRLRKQMQTIHEQLLQAHRDIKVLRDLKGSGAIIEELAEVKKERDFYKARLAEIELAERHAVAAIQGEGAVAEQQTPAAGLRQRAGNTTTRSSGSAGSSKSARPLTRHFRPAGIRR